MLSIHHIVYWSKGQEHHHHLFTCLCPKQKRQTDTPFVEGMIFCDRQTHRHTFKEWMIFCDRQTDKLRIGIVLYRSSPVHLFMSGQSDAQLQRQDIYNADLQRLGALHAKQNSLLSPFNVTSILQSYFLLALVTKSFFVPTTRFLGFLCNSIESL